MTEPATPNQRTFEFYIDDDRYDVPTLKIVMLTDGTLARVAADGLLNESPHHRGIEVFEHGARLYGLGTLAASNEGDLRATTPPG